MNEGARMDERAGVNAANVDGQSHAVEIDVWADVVCPWCYLGKRRLELAIAESAHPAEVTVTYHAYELDPKAAHSTGETVLAWLAQRYGTDLDGAREMAERPAVMGRPDGVHIDVDKQLRANSFDAHRLVALGLAQGGPALQARGARAALQRALLRGQGDRRHRDPPAARRRGRPRRTPRLCGAGR